MKRFIKNYMSTCLLVLGVVLGIVFGLIFGEKASVVSPLGDLFLNMLLVIIVPLIFLTISSSIGKIDKPKRVGKVLTTIIIVFIITSLISVCVGILSTRMNLVKNVDENKIMSVIDMEATSENEDLNILARTVEAISTNDFVNLFTRNNIIALIVMSILTGLAISLAKEKGKALLNVIDSANEVVQKLLQIIMYYAPIGLGCYVATFVGTFGSSIAVGYAKTLIIYCIACAFLFFVMYSIYALIAGGKDGLKLYWKNILPATVTAFATCSSAASIPVNTTCAKKIGVPDDIADTTIPLGTSFHKDGSVIGSVFKVMFLVCLFGTNASILKVLGVSLIATLLVTAVPIGGGTISEMLIITMMGFPVGALPILTIIATIIDAPATVLNVVGDTASSMMVSRIVEGKNWLRNKKK